MPLFKPLQVADEILNRVQRAISAAFDTLERRPLSDGQLHAPVVYMKVGGEIVANASVVVYQGDGEHRLFLPLAATMTTVAGMLLIVNFGGGPIQVAPSGSDTTYDGHELTITPGRAVKVLSDGVSKWAVLGDEIWASSSPDNWYENACDYSTEPMREGSPTSPVLYTNELQFSWVDNTHTWAVTDEGPSYPGVAHGTCGLSATASLSLHTNTGAVRLRGRSRYVAWVKIPTLSDGTQRFIFRTGLQNTVGTAPLQGIFFRYSDNLSGGNWQCVTVRSGSERVYNSGIAVVADTWYKLEWDLWVPDLICRWYISTEQTDGEIGPPVEVAVHNDTGLFFFPDDPMGVVPFDFLKTVGATARSAKIHKHRFISELGPTVPSAE